MIYTVATLYPGLLATLPLPDEKTLGMPVQHTVNRDVIISHITSDANESSVDISDILRQTNESEIIESAFDSTGRPYVIFTQSDFDSCSSDETLNIVRTQTIPVMLKHVYLMHKASLKLMQTVATQPAGCAIIETLCFLKRPLAQVLKSDYGIMPT